MKITYAEYDESIGIEFNAESMEDAAFLIRFGINQKKRSHTFGAYVTKDTVSGSLFIRKIKSPTGKVGK